MDSSRRAVESYWRSRMIDGVTSDEDKVTPVYRLEEICELLRSSHVSIVKEVSEFILKRIDHKSPIVKQKVLRLIKYAVGKSGLEFRREMQRHSVAVRQLFHYKGHPHPLRGDALNKAVRDTAHEAISAIFSEPDNKPAPAEDLTKRIQGFGNTNYELPSEDKKSFLSEVVNLGSASIKQGISNFTQVHTLGRSENGTYKSPNLHRSLTLESGYGIYNPAEIRSAAESSYWNVAPGSWHQNQRAEKMEVIKAESTPNRTGSKTREERLLEMIVSSGGVRLQPTRDVIQAFLTEAAKMDVVALCHALESKLQSPQWQVRMKAVCVLESIVRKKDDEPFSIIASYYGENRDVLIGCAESPQASLRDKTNRVLGLLAGEQVGGIAANSIKSTEVDKAPLVQMPDLIDTGDLGDIEGTANKQNEETARNPTRPTSIFYDLSGDNDVGSGVSNNVHEGDEDPFADVSFHNTESRETVDDLFSGMTMDDKISVNGNHMATNNNSPARFDFLGFQSEASQNNKNDLHDLMANLSIEENTLKSKQKEATSEALSNAIYSDPKGHLSPQVSNDALNSVVNPQMPVMGASPLASVTMPCSIPPGMVFNPALSTQPINYASMGNLLAQQQFLAKMSNFQQYGNLNAIQTAGNGHGNGVTGGYSASPLPDIFQANFRGPAPSSIGNITKKEETKAFDFISDHLAAARDSKRLV